MRRTYVQSSNLYSVGYDPASMTMEIEFRDGSVYRYFRVPVNVYAGLMAADSKGSYFYAVIRPTYSYALVA